MKVKLSHCENRQIHKMHFIQARRNQFSPLQLKICAVIFDNTGPHFLRLHMIMPIFTVLMR